MFKKIFILFLVFVMALGIIGCGEKNKLPEYESHEFELSAFWAPYDITEKGLQQYKDAGFNTLALINHSLPWSSENQYYLGSERTLTALKGAKSVGLNVILGTSEWIALGIEGEDYYGDTPFSKHDYYKDYKDIIVGVHMADEPKKSHFAGLSGDTLINDFKKVYPNARYEINLIPEYAGADPYEYETYEEMWDIYAEEILSKFETNRMASIDFYYFYARDNGKRKTGIMRNFDLFANFAKKYNTSQTFIMQSSVTNEFDSTLSEGDIRLQANMAMAFGADAMQYYCYSVPRSYDENGEISDYMYEYCIMTQDDKPSDVYNYVKKVNAEAQALAPAILSYNWQEATAVPGIANVMEVGEYYDMSDGKFENTKHFCSVQGTQNVVMSRFASEEYGEAYMLVNFAERELDNVVDLQMKDCESLAIYGGADFDGTPEIILLDEEGKCQIDLAYGEGIFIVPLS